MHSFRKEKLDERLLIANPLSKFIELAVIQRREPTYTNIIAFLLGEGTFLRNEFDVLSWIVKSQVQR